jgi:hypothetical protein
MEAIRKYVEEEPAHELARVKPHDLAFMFAVLQSLQRKLS